MAVIFTNGTIHTMDPAQPGADWVSVEGGRIAGVGVGRPPPGEPYDLAGRTLVPGFQDAHIHAPWGGLHMLNCNLHELTTLDEFVEAVATYADAHPGDGWITGGGWAMAEVPNGIARADALDAVVPDRPVYLQASEGHAGWANSMALELAGINAATPDPDDGVIERDRDGSPSGTLQEGAAFLVERCIPPTSDSEYIEATLLAQTYLHSLGITGWQDAWVISQSHKTYRRLANDGRLTAFVVGALWWDRHRGVEQLAELVELSTQGADRYVPETIKLMVDGVCENGSASLRERYCDSESRGMSFIPREVLIEAVPQIMAAGLQPHFHAIGDAAIRDALDAVEAGDPGDVQTTRPHIAHVQVIHPEDVRRFAALDVTVNAQTLWARNDGTMTKLTAPRLGQERTAWQYPYRALLDSGARMACGSDWSVSTPNVFEQMAVAVSRSSADGTDAFEAEQCISPLEALTGFTRGSAYVMHRDRSGMLREGFEADLAVATADPLSEANIAAIEVDATFASGRPVFQR